MNGEGGASRGNKGERLRRRRIKTRLIVINDHQGIPPRARSAGLVGIEDRP
jgi:hypothetical protein